VIAIEPKGGNLDVLTAETRRMALLESCVGYVTQVWIWRGGEAVVLNAYPRAMYGQGEWAVIIRRGLKRGAPQRLNVESVGAALTALGVRWRIRSCRRSPAKRTQSKRSRYHRVLLSAAHRRGNTWRTMRARIS
jgi:hypothetical protein